MPDFRVALTGTLPFLTQATSASSLLGQDGTLLAKSNIAGKISVLDYGVVGNGVVDDSAAIQAAINYAVTNNVREVLFPGNRVYSFTNVRFRSGRRYILEENARILAAPTSVTGGATVNTNDETDILIEGGVWDGNYDVVPGNPMEGNTLLRSFNSRNITVRDCTFVDNRYLAIQASGSENLRFLYNTMNNTDCGIITMAECNEVWAIGNTMTGGTSDGIAIWCNSSSAPSRGINIIGNSVHGKEDGFGVILRRVDGATVVGNAIRDCNLGIAASPEAETVVTKNVSITGNAISGMDGTYAIGGFNLEDSVIVGNAIQDCDYSGVYLAQGKRNTVTSNRVTNVNGAAADFAGISLTDASNNNVVSENAIYDTRTPIENYSGISVLGSVGNTIQNNHSPNSMSQFPILLLPSSSNNYVDGNEGVVTDQGSGNQLLRNRSGSPNTPAATTISLRDTPGDVFNVTASGAVTISTINNGFAGREITLVFTRADTTVNNAGNILLAGGTLTSAINGTLHLKYMGNKWYELSRSLTNS